MRSLKRSEFQMHDAAYEVRKKQREAVHDAWADEANAVFGPARVTNRASQPQADADGTPSLYYYDRDRTLAFHWTGNTEHKVEVAFDGDHEEALWFFDYMMFLKEDVEYVYPSIFQALVEQFGRVCRSWIDAKEDAR